MAVIQSKQNEIRYIKRANLEEEAKMYQNYYRDIIHNYGVDCNYYKIKVPYPEHFRRTLDNNNILMHAYGYDSNPKYDVSASMITYMEVDQDAFALNKYGIVPDMDVNFIFDRTEFATKFAYKMGQYKEYKIKEKEVTVEIPKRIDEYIEYIDVNGNPASYMLQDDINPYFEACGFPLTFETDILSGKASFVIGECETDKEYDILADKYQHSDGGYKIPVNDNIYRSFYYNVDIKEYLDIFISLKFKIHDIVVGKTVDGVDITKRILKGKLHGSVLFHDINQIGKYIELIQPNVGDVVTIDFPDERSREQYEITECLDKNLGQDGINPLLHKYIWKCKAKRYINSGEDNPEKNEANERIKEVIDTVQQSDEDIVKKISRYDEFYNDAVYGGYELSVNETDKQIVDFSDQMDLHTEFIDDGSYINIHVFGDGPKLVTDGYELYYITSGRNKITIRLTESEPDKENLPVEHWVASGLEYLAATNHELWFKNFDNRTYKIAESNPISQEEREICMISLINSTYSTGDINNPGDNFYKFKNCKTILISINDCLYCRFGLNGKIVKIS